MSPVRVLPSTVDPARDRMRLIGMDVPAAVLWTRPAGVDPAWGCVLVEIAVQGAAEVLRQPERLPVEVWR